MTTPDNPRADVVETAIRVHPVLAAPVERSPRPARRAELPRHVVVFDCETTTDESQRLLFGVWRHYVDDHNGPRATVCVAEGIFHADDLPDSDPDGYRVLQEYVAAEQAETASGYPRQLRLSTRSEFVDEVIWKLGHRNQAMIAGFNLPFDLTRLATHIAPARGRNRGGISLRLWEHDGGEHTYRPRIAIRSIDGHRHLIQFTSTRDTTNFYRGRFLDLTALSFAHSDRRDSLESACARFGDPYTKTATTHGEVTANYVTYCREDVAATAQLCRDTYREHLRHPIRLPANNALSPATIGRAYWQAMGITPFADRDGWIGDEVNGWGMAAFYGGRAECRIRHADVPVVYCDFASMYPTCNSLMHTWQLVTANHLRLDDITRMVCELVAAPNLVERCFDPTLWPLLHTLVEIEPDGAILPVRARYDTASATWNTGVNPLHTNRRWWYALGDVLAAAILGPAPTVVRAYRLVPTEPLAGMSTTKLYGTIPYNPAREDFFRAVVEHRRHSRTNPQLDKMTRERIGQFLKVVGNSTGFGILAQYDRRHHTDPVDITVHTDRDPFTVRCDGYDAHADYCAPPLAAAVTAAARLMLTLLEHEVTHRGGRYAFCDTDSMAIVATRRTRTITIGTEQARTLSWRQVDDIVDRFTRLNPHSADAVLGSILKIETENFHPGSPRRRQLHCYAISAKRYQLTHRGRSVKASEHGLGHLLNPTGDCGDWITDAWQWLRHTDRLPPAWLDLPALSKVTVTGPEILHWFANVNHDRPFRDRIKPGNFLLVAHPDPLAPGDQQPVAPYSPDPATWRGLGWIDRNTGAPVTITTAPRDGVVPDGRRVLTYRDVLTRYRNHPEAKSLAPDSEPVRPATVGILQRRPVTPVEPVTYIGKEAHNLHRQTDGIDPDHDIVTYTPDPLQHWHQLVVPVLATLPTRTVVASTGINLRTVQRAIAGHCTPQPTQRATLTELAVDHCREQLGTRGGSIFTVLARYVQIHSDHALRETPGHSIGEISGTETAKR